MREQRWESCQSLNFTQVLSLLDRLRAKGLSRADPDKEGICYIEEWPVPSPSAIQHLAPWALEDVTIVHVLEAWSGDFFLLSGRHHAVFRRYRSADTYCSISHPWRLSGHWATLHPLAMFWVGFRHTHAFIRIRLHTTEVILPGDTHASRRPRVWLDERQAAFREAIDALDLPIVMAERSDRVTLQTTRGDAPFFCSWPDAFGPCQFELNTPDPFAFLVPAGGLAATRHPAAADIRIYLTGFSDDAVNEFRAIEPGIRAVCRCSAHACLADLPDLLAIVGRSGRLYTTIAEFHTDTILPGRPAAAVIGIVCTANGYRVEARLNMMPLPVHDMNRRLEDLLDVPMTYATLSPFP